MSLPICQGRLQLNAGGMNVEENGERVGESEQAALAGCFEEDGERTKNEREGESSSECASFRGSSAASPKMS